MIRFEDNFDISNAAFLAAVVFDPVLKLRVAVSGGSDASQDALSQVRLRAHYDPGLTAENIEETDRDFGHQIPRPVGPEQPVLLDLKLAQKAGGSAAELYLRENYELVLDDGIGALFENKVDRAEQLFCHILDLATALLNKRTGDADIGSTSIHLPRRYHDALHRVAEPSVGADFVLYTSKVEAGQ